MKRKQLTPSRASLHTHVRSTLGPSEKEVARFANFVLVDADVRCVVCIDFGRAATGMVTTAYYLSRQITRVRRVWHMHDAQVMT